ncbi:MAG: BMP family ABC transporter substrate-binding protein [Peptostreptococcaceae bacterium]|nr:BMP family ABC transporter substrate-binding protein [Peptostreptococcaceae bacterium]
MLRKTKARLLAMVLTVGIVGMTGCSKQEKQEEVKTVTLVLDKGGVNDESFNQLAWEGAQEASEEYGVIVKYLESNSDSDYKTNVETAIDMKSDLIIGVGFNLTEAIGDAAESYPEQQFAIIDGSFEETPSNVTPILFNEKEAGYLAGLATALSIESDKFGFVGGFEIPAVVNYKDGFEQGLKEVNPNATLFVQYANSFTDAAKGKAIGAQMYSNDIDCIMTAAGGVNSGVYESGREQGKYAVAVDMAQSNISPEVIVTSALKNVAGGVKDTIGKLVDDKLVGGEVAMYDITNNGVGYEETQFIGDKTIKYIIDKIK